jgi:anti-anti-sigma factor
MRFNYREVALDSHLVNLSGPLNSNRSPDVIQLFRDLSEQGVKRVLVNLGDVPFIDSRGLSALIAGYKMFGSDPRNFRLVGIQDQPRLVFELTGFDHVFGTDSHSASGRPEAVALNVPVYELPQFAVLN